MCCTNIIQRGELEMKKAKIGKKRKVPVRTFPF